MEVGMVQKQSQCRGSHNAEVVLVRSRSPQSRHAPPRGSEVRMTNDRYRSDVDDEGGEESGVLEKCRSKGRGHRKGVSGKAAETEGLPNERDRRVGRCSL